MSKLWFQPADLSDLWVSYLGVPFSTDKAAGSTQIEIHTQQIRELSHIRNLWNLLKLLKELESINEIWLDLGFPPVTVFSAPPNSVMWPLWPDPSTEAGPPRTGECNAGAAANLLMLMTYGRKPKETKNICHMSVYTCVLCIFLYMWLMYYKFMYTHTGLHK